MEPIPQKEEMKSLVAVSNKLQKNGYTENFMVDEKGMRTMNSDKLYSPGDIHVVDFYRFEGDSDPADEAILYAIETLDGTKGTLSDSFGPYADIRITKFMSEVEGITKK